MDVLHLRESVLETRARRDTARTSLPREYEKLAPQLKYPRLLRKRLDWYIFYYALTPTIINLKHKIAAYQVYFIKQDP